MKIVNLRKKITINFSASGALLLVLGVIIFFHINKNHRTESTITQIQSETTNIKGKTLSLQQQINDIKKYRELWSKIESDKKNIDGIKMNEVNTSLKDLSQKYSILNPEIKVALPQTMTNGLFKRTTINVLFTTASLSFNAANDVKAMMFIDEFLKSLPGYIIVSNSEIRKSKKYTDQDLISLSAGKNSGSISSKVDFFWYSYKIKDPNKKDEAVSAATPDSKALDKNAKSKIIKNKAAR